MSEESSIPKLERGEIYCAKNEINGKVYIGQVRSTRPTGIKRGTRERWYEHVRSALKNEHKCVRLERAIREFGPKNFSIEILEYCRLDEIDDLEKHYILKFNSTEIECGYNMTFGGKANISEITRQTLSIKVKQQWKNDEFRQKVSEGVRKASVERWKDPETRERMRRGISRALRKRSGSDDLPDYIFYYRKNNETIGYRAAVSHLKLSKCFGSSKLSLDEKFELAQKQLMKWKEEYNI